MTQVWIPWRDHPSRRRARTFVESWWRRHGFDVQHVDVPGDPFNLAACRNEAVRRSTSSLLVIADADTIPEYASLTVAMNLASAEGGTVLPYDEYRSLRADGSRQALAGVPLERCNHMVVPGACSGVFVTTKRGWELHHGQDERFAGWGCEDAAWEMTHKTLIGPPMRVPGRVYALGHQSQDKDGAPTRSNFHRIALYAAAEGDPARIADLARGAA